MVSLSSYLLIYLLTYCPTQNRRYHPLILTATGLKERYIDNCRKTREEISPRHGAWFAHAQPADFPVPVFVQSPCLRYACDAGPPAERRHHCASQSCPSSPGRRCTAAATSAQASSCGASRGESGITINTARKVVSRATSSRSGMIQEHIQLLRYAPRAHVPHSACIERLPAIACMLAQTPAALVRRWV